MIAFIDLKAQHRRIAARLQRRMQRVIAHGAFVMGPEVEELERKLADFTGVRHCVALSSGTDALLAALMALDVRARDEVITSAFSFVAPAEVVALLGARPVFVDIDPLTYTLDPQGLRQALTPRTRVILPVSLFGQCADMDPINDLAQRHGVEVVEDAAQSFGAIYRGRRSGALSRLAATSFYPAKPLGAYGDGGACFTDDDALAERLRGLRNHGQDARYRHAIVGLNARLDTLQAAVLLTKLEVFADELEARQRLAARYTALIRARCPNVTPPTVASFNRSTFSQYTIEVDDRDGVRRHLRERGIPTVVHYPAPLHHQPVFAPPPWPLPAAETVARRVLSLPFHPYLEEAVQDHIVAALREACTAPSP